MAYAFAQFVLIIWLPVVLAMFLVLRPRQAVVWSILIGWLMLPMTGFTLPGLPDYTKMSATCLGILLGAALFDPNTLLRFRPRWADLPFVVFCLCPFLSSLTNGLGAYDGVSASLRQVVTWGLPYLVGRAYFSTADGIRELARGLVIGGLLYVPLCLYEIRMSPQLHTMIYGFHQHSFSQSFRMGGWRPTVFMQHGLMVGLWMCMTALIAIWLWRTGALRGLWGFPMSMLASLLAIVAILCKSTGAWLLLALGLITLLVPNRYVRIGFMLLLVSTPTAYYALRLPQIVSADTVISMVRPFFNDHRVESLRTRVVNEDRLSEHALNRPVLGWGGWGRNRVKNEQGRDITITDGYWIIIFGVNGLVGLGAFTLAFSYPGYVVLRKIPPEAWHHDWVPAFVGLTTVVLLFQIDCILNAMINPVYTLILGSLTGVAGIIRPATRTT
ncbi:O-antigen ligase domain-containing protein [Mucisphaera calidilacus]|uniref:O-antigen ligase domain-containing protein n=1 Tax=Mucisphaera calidilacus TaxID=2527982 RepID=A0A518BUS6_9BACT|nr:O-antigen ligase domain-containing protein [Mucisphaera calidilacus]QDU70711.1 hypothetical protein Pan265_05420 [Mucisphaera calidilacus]